MKKSKIIYPKTIDEAVDKLLSEMHNRLKKEVANSAEEDLVGNFNLGLGTYIRNAFGLWYYKNLELLRNCGSENMHPDKVSSVILKALWTHLQKVKGRTK